MYQLKMHNLANESRLLVTGLQDTKEIYTSI